MRNAISHGNIEFDTGDNGVFVIFKDQNANKGQFEVKFSIKNIANILYSLLKIHSQYIKDINALQKQSN